ncbi:hypothetical protein XH86_15610 [Bradyrhizobium guangdongense]|uniref:Uncharacterized protein n=1 Tax=Bradyrhizobium guangdongense TaxID=1325090 RepID=A0ABX6UFX6_9BRAD|nr:hypothetical protein X265_15605 [Bradyrhizobium guangdongense]QOZ60002.1 hypothetical protein XH86_15610 [Bradyrhizobium guangdongense]
MLVFGTLYPPSLRAQRSNPDCRRRKILDCFVARAPRNDDGTSSLLLSQNFLSPLAKHDLA